MVESESGHAFIAELLIDNIDIVIFCEEYLEDELFALQ